MNFFNIYLDKIKKTVIKNKKKLDIEDNQALSKITVEVLPEKIYCDFQQIFANFRQKYKSKSKNSLIR